MASLALKAGRRIHLLSVELAEFLTAILFVIVVNADYRLVTVDLNSAVWQTVFTPDKFPTTTGEHIT